jgi:hypothetical protein
VPAPAFWQKRKASLQYPIKPVPRTAVLIPGFRSQGLVRVFAEGWCAAAAQFEPQAIAGTLAQLEAIAATDFSPTHALIALGHWEDARVAEADREHLWLRFGVPLFEQIIAEDCALLAAECEAHDGLHILASLDRAIASGVIDESPCACGQVSPRWTISRGIATSA